MSITRVTKHVIDSYGVREVATSERGWEYKQGETDAQIETIEALIDIERAVEGHEDWHAAWSVAHGYVRLSFLAPNGPGETPYVYIAEDGDHTTVSPFTD